MPTKKSKPTQRLVPVVDRQVEDHTEAVLPNSDKPRIKYKAPRRKLHPEEQTYSIIQTLASYGMTKKEIAAVMLVSTQALQDFFKKYPDALQAHETGVELGRARLRSIIWEHAENNPQMAKFLAEQPQWLGYSGSPKPTVSITMNANLAPEDRLKKIAELQQKVIDLTPIKEESNADD